MGHSITDFRGQAFGTKDFKLDVWLKLLANEVGREKICPGWLAEARDHWATVGDWSGVGCIDAQLDRFLIEQGQVDVVVSLTLSTLKGLEERGPVLTRDFLNELISTGQDPVFTEDLNTEMFARVGHAFLRLLRQQFDSVSATMAMQWF